MLTTLMNEGANKWRNDENPDLWKRAEYGRAKNHGRGLNGSVKKEKTRRDTAVSLATTTVGCACLSTYVRPHVAPLHCLKALHRLPPTLPNSFCNVHQSNCAMKAVIRQM